MESFLTLDRVSVARGPYILARDVTRTIAPGDLLLLVGPNGSGKTSFLRALAGLLTHADGQIHRHTPACTIGAASLAPSLETPRQYLAYQASLNGDAFDAQSLNDPFRITSVLDTPLNRLSTGWRQRVKLTRLMLAPCKLWLLDEPSTGLDAAGESILQDLLGKHRLAGGAAIIATHDAHLWPSADSMSFEVRT